MKAVCKTSTPQNSLLNEVLECISSFDCSKHFTSHLGKSSKEQKKIVKDFQNKLKFLLETSFTQSKIGFEIKWETEHKNKKLLGVSDSIDIIGNGNDFSIIIELDKHRSDQVAKKFISRTAIFSSKTIYFISLCYPGTKKMNKNECKKYFEYCLRISNSLGNNYAGMIIE